MTVKKNRPQAVDVIADVPTNANLTHPDPRRGHRHVASDDARFLVRVLVDILGRNGFRITVAG